MTETVSQAAARPERKGTARWLLAAGVVALGLGLHLSKSLLDADDHDIRYSQLLVPAKWLSDPKPGDVFVFNHATDRFVTSRLCRLQASTDVPVEAGFLKALNHWGEATNAAIGWASDYLPARLQPMLRVEKPGHEWQYEKAHRVSITAPMEAPCLKDVIQTVEKPHLTSFIVDVVYTVESAENVTKFVGFANPVLLANNSCGQCPQPMLVSDLVEANTFTRFKRKWGIVSVN